jgi:glycerophosphoryl diester phosphodiesterase
MATAPQRGGWATVTANGTNACTYDISALPTGAWIIALITTDTTGVSALPTSPATGWRHFLQPGIFQQATGSRRTGIVGRIKQAGETTISWSTTGSSNKRMTVFWGTGSRAIADFIMGTIGVRNAADAVAGQSVQAGTSTTTIAPAIAVPEADSLTLSVFLEASTSTGAASITAGGATLWFNAGDEATYIEQHSVAYLTPAAGTTAPVTATYSQTQASNSLGFQIVIPASNDAPVPIGTPVKLANGTTAYESYIDGAGARKTFSRVSLWLPGFSSVSALRAKAGATMAHRGGSLQWPEYSEVAYDRSVQRGAGALEISCGFTSDNIPFGLGDQYLDRTAGVTGNVDPTTMTWATLSSTYRNVLRPLASGVTQPFYRLDQMLAKYTPHHVCLVDPKFGWSTPARLNALLDICDANGGPDRIVIKFDFPLTDPAIVNAAKARPRPYTTMNYWGTDQAALTPSYHTDKWDWIGVRYDADQAMYDAAKAIGKPVWAAVIPDQAGYATAAARGADLMMCSNVAGITQVGAV